MIIGVGTDLIEIERVKKACDRQGFFTRCFSINEQNLIKVDLIKAAGNWAVKESVSKAFGTGISGFDLCEIEVLRDEKGKPFINLFGKALAISNELGIKKLHVSISNTKDYALAYVVAEGED